ncbi:hypothetical protein ATCC90586_003467 [Pythium insidiosum]|nr:hypothetical protein ATCC90586_003467 [Pythium insidiosum]
MRRPSLLYQVRRKPLLKDWDKAFRKAIPVSNRQSANYGGTNPTASLAEVIVVVSRFVGKWLEIVEAVVVSEAKHLSCIDISDERLSFETWNEQQQENGSVARLELHACGDALHWRPVDATSVEELKDTSTLPRDLLEDASTKLRVLDEFDTRDTSKRTVGWTSLRAEMVATLAQVATAFIRNELEQHTNTLSRQLTSYGVGKLVDKTVKSHLHRKAKRLREEKPVDTESEAKRQKRIGRPLHDRLSVVRLNNLIKNANKGILSNTWETDYNVSFLLMEAVRFDEVRDQIKSVLEDPRICCNARLAALLTYWKKSFHKFISVPVSHSRQHKGKTPTSLRRLRNLDRWIHAERYPELIYPELYLIHGGYKNCFETLKPSIYRIR